MTKAQPANLGHNLNANKEQLRKGIEYIAKKMNAIEALRGDIKAKKSELKDSGFSKIATSRALKFLRMTDEQRQSEEEIREQTDMITEQCADLPLWAAAND